jgi:hypothetical protein
MTATLVIERAADGWRDRYGSYEVIVDDELRGELWRGERRTIEVEPGEVEVYIKIDWCKSRLVRLKIDAESEAHMVCRPRSILTAIYWVTLGRNSYVRLDLT